MLDGLLRVRYSQVLSHYCLTRALLPAGFPPWAGTSLLRQPGASALRQGPHVDAKLSADTRSTQHNSEQNSRPHTVPPSGLQVAGLQVHAAAPGRQQTLRREKDIRCARQRPIDRALVAVKRLHDTIAGDVLSDVIQLPQATIRSRPVVAASSPVLGRLISGFVA